jgi:hypothetical protein
MPGLFVFLAVLVFNAAPSAAQTACPADIETTVAQAKAALTKREGIALTDQGRVALSCLADAVGTLDAKLNDLVTGKITFTGPVISQKGFINQGDKPATEEAR